MSRLRPRSWRLCNASVTIRARPPVVVSADAGRCLERLRPRPVRRSASWRTRLRPTGSRSRGGPGPCNAGFTVRADVEARRGERPCATWQVRRRPSGRGRSERWSDVQTEEQAAASSRPAGVRPAPARGSVGRSGNPNCQSAGSSAANWHSTPCTPGALTAWGRPSGEARARRPAAFEAAPPVLAAEPDPHAHRTHPSFTAVLTPYCQLAREAAANWHIAPRPPRAPATPSGSPPKPAKRRRRREAPGSARWAARAARRGPVGPERPRPATVRRRRRSALPCWRATKSRSS